MCILMSIFNTHLVFCKVFIRKDIIFVVCLCLKLLYVSFRTTTTTMITITSFILFLMLKKMSLVFSTRLYVAFLLIFCIISNKRSRSRSHKESYSRTPQNTTYPNDNTISLCRFPFVIFLIK
jgi:hypothetical protein